MSELSFKSCDALSQLLIQMSQATIFLFEIDYNLLLVGEQLFMLGLGQCKLAICLRELFSQ